MNRLRIRFVQLYTLLSLMQPHSIECAYTTLDLLRPGRVWLGPIAQQYEQVGLHDSNVDSEPCRRVSTIESSNSEKQGTVGSETNIL
jgi:hypothetical protein